MINSYDTNKAETVTKIKIYKHFRKRKLPNVTVQKCASQMEFLVLLQVNMKCPFQIYFVIIPVLDGNAPQRLMQQKLKLYGRHFLAVPMVKIFPILIYHGI